jgi:hypothetical protein
MRRRGATSGVGGDDCPVFRLMRFAAAGFVVFGAAVIARIVARRVNCGSQGGTRKAGSSGWIELRPGHTAVGVSYWKNEKKKHSRGLVKGGLNAFDTLYDS